MTTAAVIVVFAATMGVYRPAVQGQTQTSEQQLAQLRQQVTALERRVVELEKLKGGVVAGPPGKTSEGPKGEQGRSATSSGSSVIAPFTVVDSAGRVIMRVDDDGNGLARGAYFYGAAGKIGSHIGTNIENGGGRVYVSMGANPQVGMSADSDGGFLMVRGAGKAHSMARAESISFISESGATIALFGSKDSTKGYFEVNEADGSIMVEGGSLKSHKGYVLANPYKASTALTGDPSVLRGGGR